MSIQLIYRQTNKLSIRIVRNGDVHVSVPIGMSRNDVETFINCHLDWIERARKKTNEQQTQRAAFFNQLPMKTMTQKNEATEKLMKLIEPMIENHSKKMGVSPSSVSYKPMISRWGICNVRERSIKFSTYLLLLPEWCVEHVVVHELCHLLEPSHNAFFYDLMDKYYPRWRDAGKEIRRIQRERFTNDRRIEEI